MLIPDSLHNTLILLAIKDSVSEVFTLHLRFSCDNHTVVVIRNQRGCSPKGYRCSTSRFLLIKVLDQFIDDYRVVCSHFSYPPVSNNVTIPLFLCECVRYIAISKRNQTTRDKKQLFSSYRCFSLTFFVDASSYACYPMHIDIRTFVLVSQKGGRGPSEPRTSRDH